MKNLDGIFELKNYVDKWFSNTDFITKCEEERTGLDCYPLLLRKNCKNIWTFSILIFSTFLKFFKTFSYLFLSCDVTSLGNIHSIIFWKYAQRC